MERTEQFITHIKKTNPNIDVEEFIKIFNDQTNIIRSQMNNNEQVIIPIDSDLSCNIALTTMRLYLESNQ